MEILHFTIKHHVAVDILKTIRWFLAIRYNLECNLHIFHFFLYGILPEGISTLFINGICLIDCLRQLDTKLMGLSKVPNATFSHNEGYPVPFPEDVMNPPVECWFMFYSLFYNIFSNLGWMQFLKVGKFLL